MKYRLCRCTVAAFLVLVTFFYPLLAPTPHRLDYIHFGRIKPGMTREHVEAIFGVPEGIYDGVPPSFVASLIGDRSLMARVALADLGLTGDWTQATWFSRNGAFDVYFDRDGRVLGSSHFQRRFVPFWQEWLQTIKGRF